jgi:riboflavin kinase/FMN adenylyltransferase
MQLVRFPQLRHLPSQGCVATLGNFDGVHIGHRQVIENLAREGKRLNLSVVVVLFEPQPREFFTPAEAPPRLTRLREKLMCLREMPVDRVLLLHFDRHLAEMPAEHFIQSILVDTLKVRHLVVGDDFRFGQDRRGDFAMLQAAGRLVGFSVADTESVQLDGLRISSTLVRETLAAGAMDLVARYLGRPYTIVGRVAPGSQLGRQIGFPTANIALRRKNTPLQGVFAVTMTGIGNRPWPGVANIGSRPTVDRKPTVLLEVHLFDFDQDIYGRLVEVQFHHKIRDEQRFDSVDALRSQIARDAEAAQDFFAE